MQLGCVGCANSGSCGMGGLGQRCPGGSPVPNSVDYGDIIAGGSAVQYYGDVFPIAPGANQTVQYDENGIAFSTVGGTFEETMMQDAGGIPLWIWIVGGFLILYSGQSRKSQ